MKLKPSSYNLKDFDIFNSPRSFDHSVWIPDKTYIVIGRSNGIETSVKMKAAKDAEIEILKRPSGGEAVILTPKMIIISLKFKMDNDLNTHKYFKLVNYKIIDVLSGFGVKGLGMKGISDIAIGDKKILGSSIYRKSNIIFYHAVLNVSEALDLMEKYLKHPKKEPKYRKGRSHIDFVTSLKAEGYNPDLLKVANKLKTDLKEIKFADSTGEVSVSL